MAINPGKCITIVGKWMKSDGDSGDYTHVRTIPGALDFLLLFSLSLTRSSILDQTDRVIRTRCTNGYIVEITDDAQLCGEETDIAVLSKAAAMFMDFRSDAISAMRQVVELTGCVNCLSSQQVHDCIQKALNTSHGTACLVMLLICGVTNQWDIMSGIDYFMKLQGGKDGTTNFVTLLEWKLEHPDSSIKETLASLHP